jgi:hypothetical protein
VGDISDSLTGQPIQIKTDQTRALGRKDECVERCADAAHGRLREVVKAPHWGAEVVGAVDSDAGVAHEGEDKAPSAVAQAAALEDVELAVDDEDGFPGPAEPRRAAAATPKTAPSHACRPRFPTPQVREFITAAEGMSAGKSGNGNYWPDPPRKSSGRSVLMERRDNGTRS